MPSLVPIVQKKPVFQRLGNRNGNYSSMESLRSHGSNYSRRSNYSVNRSNNGIRKNGVQHRLQKSFINPAVVARNTFCLNAINSFMDSAVKTLGNGDQMDVPKEVLTVIASKLLSVIDSKSKEEVATSSKENASKYDMKIQKEICALQV